jgi:hypothetical protein
MAMYPTTGKNIVTKDDADDADDDGCFRMLS